MVSLSLSVKFKIPRPESFEQPHTLKIKRLSLPPKAKNEKKKKCNPQPQVWQRSGRAWLERLSRSMAQTSACEDTNHLPGTSNERKTNKKKSQDIFVQPALNHQRAKTNSALSNL